MLKTRRIYRATFTTVDCAYARRRTILVGLFISVLLTFMHVPSVSAKAAIIKDPSALRGATPNSNYHADSAHPTRLLVRFEPSTSRALEDTIHNRAGAHRVLNRYRLVEGLCLVEVAEGQREAVMKRYADERLVLYAQPDYEIRANVIPDDPSFPLQWGLQNTGQTIGTDPGTPGADIRAEWAWDLTTGNAAFQEAGVVAVSLKGATN